MPVVRGAERQVGTAALPGARRQAAETAESQGAGLARARATINDTIGAVGNMAARAGIAAFTGLREQERERANQVALLAASSELDKWELERLHDPEKGALNVRGEASFTLPEDIDQEYEKVAGTIEAKLGTPEQKAAWSRMKQERGANIALNIRRHVAGEMRTYETTKLKATIEGAQQLAIANALDPRRVGVEMTRAIDAMRAAAPRLGVSQEVLDQQIRAFQSGTHEGVIENLIANDQERAAAAYFAEAREQIHGDRHDDITKMLEAGSLKKQGQEESDKIIAAGGTLTEQRAKAKQIADPKLRDEVMARIEHEATVQDRVEREQKEATMRGAYDIVDRTGRVGAIPSNVWA